MYENFGIGERGRSDSELEHVEPCSNEHIRFMLDRGASSPEVQRLFGACLGSSIFDVMRSAREYLF